MSKFKIYTIGKVAEDKEINSKEILVYPIEIIPYRDGSIESKPEESIASGVDRSGKSYQVKVTTDNTIRAEWLNLGGSNRATPPNVVRDERVIIYQYGDANKFYWTTTGWDDNLRNNETILIRACNNPDKSDPEHRDDNSYWAELSTHKKSVTIQTSNSSGEKFVYAIRIDADKSNVIITDDVGNKILLSSETNRIELTNADNTTIYAEGKNIILDATESISLKTKKLSIQADTIDLKANNTKMETNLNLDGNSDFNGNIENTGNINNNGKITSNDITLSTHLHPADYAPPNPGT